MAKAVYVLCDEQAHTIIDGPWDYDPATQAVPQNLGGRLRLQSEAVGLGYTVVPKKQDPAVVILAKIPAAIAANNAFINNGAPTNAQVVAHLKIVSRELNALARLAAQLLDDTTDS